MKLAKKTESLDLIHSVYECSLCKVDYKSFGKMQEHMLKDHLLNVRSTIFSYQDLSRLDRFLQTVNNSNFCDCEFPLNKNFLPSFKPGVE